MTDDELYEVVKDHREAWPEHVRYDDIGGGEMIFCIDGGGYSSMVRQMFEATFPRAILKHTYCMRVEDHGDIKHVIVKHHQFEAPTLIEAYAKALEWLE
jgi:hypothetical protein